MTPVAQASLSRPLGIYIIAAEESGDALGAALANALAKRLGGAVKLSGIGGRAMAAAGISSPFAIDDLAIVGLAAIPRSCRKFFVAFARPRMPSLPPALTRSSSLTARTSRTGSPAGYGGSPR